MSKQTKTAFDKSIELIEALRRLVRDLGRALEPWAKSCALAIVASVLMKGSTPEPAVGHVAQQRSVQASGAPRSGVADRRPKAKQRRPRERLFGLERAFFWADLDRAAFSIYRSMRNAIPHLRLSGIYHAMMPMLARPESSHPYCTLVKKDGQVEVGFAKGAPIEGELCELWTACATRAVDQEAVREADILRRGHTSYVAGAS